MASIGSRTDGLIQHSVLAWSKNREGRSQVKKEIPKRARVQDEAKQEVRLSETGIARLQSKGVDKEAEEKLQFQLHPCSG